MRFCDSFISHIKWADPDTSLEKETVYFDEVRHWHSKRPITDDYDHVKSDPVFDKNSADHWQIKQLVLHVIIEIIIVTLCCIGIRNSMLLNRDGCTCMVQI